MSPDTNRHLRTRILLLSSLSNDPVQFIDRLFQVKDEGGLVIAVDAETQHRLKGQQKIPVDAGQVTRVFFFEVFIPAVKGLIPVCHAEAFFQHHLQPQFRTVLLAVCLLNQINNRFQRRLFWHIQIAGFLNDLRHLIIPACNRSFLS